MEGGEGNRPRQPIFTEVGTNEARDPGKECSFHSGVGYLIGRSPVFDSEANQIQNQNPDQQTIFLRSPHENALASMSRRHLQFHLTGEEGTGQSYLIIDAIPATSSNVWFYNAARENAKPAVPGGRYNIHNLVLLFPANQNKDVEMRFMSQGSSYDASGKTSVTATAQFALCPKRP